MQKKFMAVFICLMLLVLQGMGFAAPKWNDVVTRIEKSMNQSLAVYEAGDVAGAKKLVNDTYYGIYEKDGMEMAVRSTVSSKRAGLTEYKFSTVKKLMTNQAPSSEIKKEITEMISMMREDVKKMSGSNKEQSSWESFWPAFLILVREGVEAILVIGAILAYLIKSGNGDKTQIVYSYSGAAIVASFLTAIAFHSLVGASGANQEILEGATMLVAVAVLLSVSYWMGSKSDQKQWKEYIEGKVQKSLTSRSAFALGAASFLAVYREGAEVVLFYQALFNEAGDDMQMIWFGFGAGCLALAVIFALVRYGTLKIPLKPFFQGTSIFMSLLAVSFAGGGMKELQEGGVVGVTPIDGFPMIDLLGIYPTWETLLPQAILLLLLAAGFIYQKKKMQEVVS
ncbi:MAG: FTR1 family protein [Sporomusaceae bacterium]|nr:FTR1 family protein [Sporomusaceae bacterium]